MSRYKILEKIGEGGMGDVFRALHESLRREVAIKLVRVEKQDAATLKRFRREIDACTRLNHPHIVKIYDSGELEGQFYYSMELIRAPTLRQWMLKRGAIDVERTMSIMHQLFQALAYCHQNGFVHRDLKPANVMIDETGHVTLMDFGLVKQLNQTVVTEVGKIVGTPRYLAPEVLQGQNAGPGVDVWAAGILFYELLTGRGAFPGDDMMSYMKSVLQEDPYPLAKFTPGLPPTLELFLGRCFSKNPQQRFKDCVEALDAFERIRDDPDDAEALNSPADEDPEELPAATGAPGGLTDTRPIPRVAPADRRTVSVLVALACAGLVTSVILIRGEAPEPVRSESPQIPSTAAAPEPVTARVEAILTRLRDFDPEKVLDRLGDDFFIPLEELAVRDPERDKLVTQWRRRLEVRVKEFDLAAALDELGRISPAYFTDPAVTPGQRFAMIEELEKLTSLVETAIYHGIPLDLEPLSAVPPGTATRVEVSRGGEPGRRTLLFSYAKLDLENQPEFMREDLVDRYIDPSEESIYFAVLGKVIGSLGEEFAAPFHKNYPHERVELPRLVRVPPGDLLEYVDFVLLVKHVDAARYFILELETPGGWIPVAHLRGPRRRKRVMLRYRLDRAHFAGSPMRFALRLSGSSPFRKPARVESIAFQVKMKDGAQDAVLRLLPLPGGTPAAQGKRKG